MDKRSNQQMIVDLVQNEIMQNNGVRPEKIDSLNDNDRKCEIL